MLIWEKHLQEGEGDVQIWEKHLQEGEGDVQKGLGLLPHLQTRVIIRLGGRKCKWGVEKFAVRYCSRCWGAGIPVGPLFTTEYFGWRVVVGVRISATGVKRGIE